MSTKPGAGHLAQSSFMQRPSKSPYNLTDQSWIKGVHKSSAMIFVSNTPQNLNQYQVGKMIKFSDGNIREIIRIDNSSMYLVIVLSGDPLDGTKVGFPNKLEIVK